MLLLTSGHTVRIQLRDGELAEPNERDKQRTGAGPGWDSISEFANLNPAIVGYDEEAVIFAYIEDPTFPAMRSNGFEFEEPNDFQRIGVLSPGDAGSTA